MKLIAAFFSQVIAAFFPLGKTPKPFSYEEGDCQIQSPQYCGAGYTDICLNDCSGVCVTDRFDQDVVLDYPHMICDKQSGQWIDAQSEYPED